MIPNILDSLSPQQTSTQERSKQRSHHTMTSSYIHPGDTADRPVPDENGIVGIPPNHKATWLLLGNMDIPSKSICGGCCTFGKLV